MIFLQEVFMHSKYNKLSNHTQHRSISSIQAHSDVHQRWSVQEKIDGSNFQIYITRDSVSYGKRNSMLASDTKFFGFQEVVAKYSDYIERIQDNLSPIHGITLYAEIFGGNVQKRISYTEEKQIKVFDLDILEYPYSEPIRANAKTVKSMFDHLDMADWLVPTLFVCDSFDEALATNVKRIDTEVGDDSYDPYNNKLIEGVVIKPYDKVIVTAGSVDPNTGEHYEGGYHVIKKKSEGFKDKEHKKNGPTVTKSSDPIVSDLRNHFEGYINDNRVADYISKEGAFESMDQLGPYIVGIIADAREDFEQDYPEVLTVSKNAQKQIYKVGGVISSLLKGYM